MPMTQCPGPSLIPSALRSRSEQLGQRAGSRTWREALAHSRPEDPVPRAPAPGPQAGPLPPACSQVVPHSSGQAGACVGGAGAEVS